MLAALIGSAALASFPLTDVETNVCNLVWNYCPRDPGCVTYTMSVHEVFVRDENITAAVRLWPRRARKCSLPLSLFRAAHQTPLPPTHASRLQETAMQLTPKDTIMVEIKGETSLASVPATGSYKIYNLAGDTTFTGDLQKAMTITGTAKPYDFTLEVEFPLTEGSFIRGSNFFEFGVDVFQASSGADEGMCIEISNEIYVKYEEDKPVPPGPAFDMNCDDHGDGTFSAHVHKIVPTPIASPGCGGCDLDWYYCPRDPGCTTYTMSVESVTFDDANAGPLAAKDPVRLLVNGTTTLSSVPHYGTFVIYELNGGEIMQGELRKNNAMTVSPRAQGETWSNFALDIPFTLDQGAFEDPYFEIGLDVFQAR